MKEKIEEQLNKINEKNYYGLVPENEEIDIWNYCVIGKGPAKKKSDSSMDLQAYIYVDIIREEEVTDDVLKKIIKTVLSIPGIRVADRNIEYDYIHKGNTDLVCEAVRIYFTRTIKDGLSKN